MTLQMILLYSFLFCRISGMDRSHRLGSGSDVVGGTQHGGLRRHERPLAIPSYADLRLPDEQSAGARGHVAAPYEAHLPAGGLYDSTVGTRAKHYKLLSLVHLDDRDYDLNDRYERFCSSSPTSSLPSPGSGARRGDSSVSSPSTEPLPGPGNVARRAAAYVPPAPVSQVTFNHLPQEVTRREITFRSLTTDSFGPSGQAKRHVSLYDGSKKGGQTGGASTGSLRSRQPYRMSYSTSHIGIYDPDALFREFEEDLKKNHEQRLRGRIKDFYNIFLKVIPVRMYIHFA